MVDNSRRSCRRLIPWRRHVSLDSNPFNRHICVVVAASLLFIRCRNQNELGRYIVVVTRIYRTANAVIRVRRLRSSLRRSAYSSATASSLPTPRSVALRVLPLPARSPSLPLPTLLGVRLFRSRRDSPPPLMNLPLGFFFLSSLFRIGFVCVAVLVKVEAPLGYRIPLGFRRRGGVAMA